MQLPNTRLLWSKKWASLIILVMQGLVWWWLRKVTNWSVEESEYVLYGTSSSSCQIALLPEAWIWKKCFLSFEGPWWTQNRSDKTYDISKLYYIQCYLSLLGCQNILWFVILLVISCTMDHFVQNKCLQKAHAWDLPLFQKLPVMPEQLFQHLSIESTNLRN